jgi:hypothetical protein
MPVWLMIVPENETKLLLEWQVSQAILVGMWGCDPVGLDTGVTPAKTWPLWHVEQPLTMPVCFISVPENDVKLLVEWQVSQVILVGRWDGDSPSLDFGVTPVNTWPLWQFVQPMLMPVWDITPEPGPYVLWHVEHFCVVGKCPAGGVVRFATRNVVVEVWQAEQSSEVGMCDGEAEALDLGVTPPAKVVPLWHVAQPLKMPVCFITPEFGPVPALWQVEHGCVVGRWFGGSVPPDVSWFQAIVLWQASHDSLVEICPIDFPFAVVPLWQVRQEPGATPTWLYFTGVQAVVWWHLSQGADVATCLVVFDCAPMRLPATWQLAQSRGVPLNTLSTWQDEHRATRCEPVSTNPVVLWSNLKLPGEVVAAEANCIMSSSGNKNTIATHFGEPEKPAIIFIPYALLRSIIVLLLCTASGHRSAAFSLKASIIQSKSNQQQLGQI